MTPVHGDVMVLAPGSCGAAAGVGHVNVIDVVAATGLTAVEQNPAGRNSYYTQSCAKCFLHVVANDGTAGGGVVATGSGGSGAAGMPAISTGGAGSGGAAAAPGTGGVIAPPTNPPAQPAAAMPPPSAAVPPVPAMLAPATPPPVAPTPTAPPPVNTMPAATAGMTGGSGGAAQTPAEMFSPTPAGETQQPGCSVVRARGSTHGVAQGGVLLALAWIAGRARSRARRRM
jgi:hypothetical protein